MVSDFEVQEIKIITIMEQCQREGEVNQIIDSEIEKDDLVVVLNKNKFINECSPRKCISECLREYVDYFLKEMVVTVPAYFRDSQDTIHKISTMAWKELNIWETLDVQSLYSQLNHVDEAIEFILAHNIMSFNGQIYRQITGTDMGTKFAPWYAGLFMEEEWIILMMMTDIVGWYHYIDVVILVWSGPEDDLMGFLNDVNDNPYDIKFSMQHHENPIDFLDLTFYVENNVVMSKLYGKKIAGNTILRKNSFHPLNTVKYIPYAQLVKIYCNCRDENIFYRLRKNVKDSKVEVTVRAIISQRNYKRGNLKLYHKQEKEVRCILEYGLLYKAVKKSILNIGIF
ncbi:hypothetical protein XELAEV_18001752mg [Xenopus laevis]|uniref:Reverse transcriptase domain-containing protein n=1 Tax=Xenopus laevis TaxID=8355 RepID=A0A974BQC5_XENLA|nr:hypothetical protein XELAEV_18001752mg [Xenopus laevis]